MIEQQIGSKIEKNSYPIWVKLFLGGVLLLFIVNMISFPRYYSAAAHNNKAEKLLEEKKYIQSESEYATALAIVPDAKNVRIGYARALFSDTNPANDEKALAALEGIKLENDDWNKIKMVMPDKYIPLFNTSTTD
jgi:hypothetical protein